MPQPLQIFYSLLFSSNRTIYFLFPRHLVWSIRFQALIWVHDSCIPQYRVRYRLILSRCDGISGRISFWSLLTLRLLIHRLRIDVKYHKIVCLWFRYYCLNIFCWVVHSIFWDPKLCWSCPPSQNSRSHSFFTRCVCYFSTWTTNRWCLILLYQESIGNLSKCCLVIRWDLNSMCRRPSSYFLIFTHWLCWGDLTACWKTNALLWWHSSPWD